MDPSERGRLIYKLADLFEKHQEELSYLESLDNGKPLTHSSHGDVPLSLKTYRYYAGWADKIHGKTLPTGGNYFAYQREEPIGVVG